MICGVCRLEFTPILGSRSPLCSPGCRFVAKAEIASPDECWEWTGAQDSSGYGHMRDGRKTVKAHRFSYESAIGPIPDGLEIDHLCRNRACVNPDHLEPVTDYENWIRGNQPGAIVVRSGLCKRGHSMEDAIVKSDGKYRHCRTCRNERKRQKYAEQRGQTNG